MAPTSFGPGGLYGGGERYAEELTRALRPEFDCRLVTFRRNSQGADRAGWVDSGRARAHLRHPAHPLAVRFLRRLAPADIVHVHQLHALPSRLALLLARLRGQVRVVTDHGLRPPAWQALVPRAADAYFTVSQYSLTHLPGPGSGSRVIYGGADTARFQPEPGRRREGVLFVGRITPHKGLDRLLAALPQRASLTVAGTGGHDSKPPESGYRQALLGGPLPAGVRVVEEPSDEVLAGLYRSAAVLALPSVARTCYGRDVEISELLSLTVLEAMASGTPVVASRIGGLPEVVRDGETGYLVEPGDVAGLRQRLEELLTHPELAGQLGANGRELVEQQFTWARCAARCAAGYRELLAGQTD